VEIVTRNNMPNLPILVVDDEPQVLAFVSRRLAKWGFSVVQCANGMEALAAMQNLDGAVSLVVSDFEMRDLDGAAVARAVKAQFPSVPVLLMSSAAFASDCSGGDGFLAKPFVASQLAEAVGALCGKQEMDLVRCEKRAAP
jgi:CheY-like chemotaxis protein